MSVLIQRCRRCDARWFPDRLVCGSCGAASFDRVAASACHIEQVTVLADGTSLAAATIEPDVPVIVRLAGDIRAGDDVPLTDDPVVEGAAAYLPTRAEHDEADR